MPVGDAALVWDMIMKGTHTQEVNKMPQAGSGGGPGRHGDGVPGVRPSTYQRGVVQVTRPPHHGREQQQDGGSGQPSEGQEEVGVDV